MTIDAAITRSLTPMSFAQRIGISLRSAQSAFKGASGGKLWRGHRLPIIRVDGIKGGRGGEAWGLMADLCSPELRDLLGLAETLPSKTLEERLQGRAEDWQIAVAADKYRVLTPVLLTQPGSRERGKAIRKLAAQPAHQIGGKWMPVAERTLYDWLNAAEGDVSGLLPVPRSDRGQQRVRISRAWDAGCGLPEEVQDQIAGKLAGIARGLLVKGRSERNTRTLCAVELQKLTVEAGAELSRSALAQLCKLNFRWSEQFRDMKVVHAFAADNKTYTDRHEFHVRRGLTARPMEVLMGDVNKVDLTISEALSSKFKKVRDAAFDAAVADEVSISAWLIAWMDGSSGYMWVTPVITGPGQGITQQDVALSLYEVLTCPWGGMPQEFMIDNGGEYSFLADCVIRFAAMAELSGLGVVKCRPYHPEGKARIEGAFGIVSRGFLSALPGYNGGNILKPRLKSRGKPVAPYDRGPDRLIEDLHLAVAQYNGTVQQGDLAGLSPKAMLSAKAEATGWQAQRIDDPDMFDLVFSREERRALRQGTITIGNRRYSGAVLAKLVGEKKVTVLVPWRDPDGPVILFRDGVIHHLTEESFALNDREGAVRKSEMVGLQKSEIARRKATAAEVDVQKMLSDAADLGPVQHNPPANWGFNAIDKGGFLGAPISEAEARARQDEEDRADIEEYLSMKRAGRREAGDCTHQASLNAT
ncbi:MAG: Mu transposase C-terminal domain-containing protein [Pseudorhodobacter sp.]